MVCKMSCSYQFRAKSVLLQVELNSEHLSTVNATKAIECVIVTKKEAHLFIFFT